MLHSIDAEEACTFYLLNSSKQHISEMNALKLIATYGTWYISRWKYR